MNCPEQKKEEPWPSLPADDFSTLLDRRTTLPKSNLPPAWAICSEADFRRELHGHESAVISHQQSISFLGAGTSHDHVPARVIEAGLRYDLTHQTWSEAERSALVRNYTGVLANLTGMEVVSPRVWTRYELLYHALRLTALARPGRSLVYVAEAMPPPWKAALAQLLPDFQWQYHELPQQNGATSAATMVGLMNTQVAAVIVATPNFFGALEPMSELGQLAHQVGALLIAVVDPASLALVRTPGEYCANFALGDLQGLGLAPEIPGGNHFFFAAQRHLLSEAETPETPSACCAMARVAAYLQMTEGHEFTRRAHVTWQSAHFLAEALAQIPGYALVHSAPFWRAFVLRTPCSAEGIVAELEDQGIFAGLPLSTWGLPSDQLLLEASERLTKAEMEYFLRALKQMGQRHAGKNQQIDC